VPRRSSTAPRQIEAARPAEESFHRSRTAPVPQKISGTHRRVRPSRGPSTPMSVNTSSARPINLSIIPMSRAFQHRRQRPFRPVELGATVDARPTQAGPSPAPQTHATRCSWTGLRVGKLTANRDPLTCDFCAVRNANQASFVQAGKALRLRVHVRRPKIRIGITFRPPASPCA